MTAIGGFRVGVRLAGARETGTSHTDTLARTRTLSHSLALSWAQARNLTHSHTHTLLQPLLHAHSPHPGPQPCHGGCPVARDDFLLRLGVHDWGHVLGKRQVRVVWGGGRGGRVGSSGLLLPASARLIQPYQPHPTPPPPPLLSTPPHPHPTTHAHPPPPGTRITTYLWSGSHCSRRCSSVQATLASSRTPTFRSSFTRSRASSFFRRSRSGAAPAGRTRRRCHSSNCGWCFCSRAAPARALPRAI